MTGSALAAETATVLAQVWHPLDGERDEGEEEEDEDEDEEGFSDDSDDGEREVGPQSPYRTVHLDALAAAFDAQHAVAVTQQQHRRVQQSVRSQTQAAVQWVRRQAPHFPPVTSPFGRSPLETANPVRNVSVVGLPSFHFTC